MPIHIYIYYVFSNKGSIHEAVLRPEFQFAEAWRVFGAASCLDSVWCGAHGAQLTKEEHRDRCGASHFVYGLYIYMGYISYITLYIYGLY
jgi:hypothetical protein